MSAAVKGGWLRTRGVSCNQRKVAEDEGCQLPLAGAVTSIIFVLPRQAYLCSDKHVFVATKHVATNICTKIFCRDKTFVAASILLSRQKT